MAGAKEIFDLNENVDGGEEEEERDEINVEREKMAKNNSAESKLVKKRRCNRHTQEQIQKMEAVFKECPHPSKKERMDIGEELGLDPLQVKFWFQNKRTQMKSKHGREEMEQLKAEIRRLENENKKYKEGLKSGDYLLRMENARLRDEIERVSAIAAKYVGWEARF